jgi:predicted Fe-Mo cluster-binding NifX family protein
MKSKRIAIGTADGVTLCDHLARSTSFLVLEIEEGSIASRTVRSRSADTCGNHKSFVEILDGCGAVLCGGIGQGAYDSLVTHGIEPLVLAGKCSVEEAAAGYLAGSLVTTPKRVCLCN